MSLAPTSVAKGAGDSTAIFEDTRAGLGVKPSLASVDGRVLALPSFLHLLAR